MKFQKLLFAVFAITLLSFGGWFIILQTIDPFTTDWFSRFIFYLTALVALWGSLAMVMFFLKRKKAQNIPYKLLLISIRQGLIISMGIVGLLVLQTINVLNILSASVYIIALVLIEFYFRTRNPNYA